jgi:hypothetical protein
MIDVFRIGVSIGMTNEVSPVIGTIQRDLAGLGKAVERASAGFSGMRLAAMGAGGAGRMAGSLGLATRVRNVVRERAVVEAPSGAWRGVMEALGRIGGSREKRAPVAGQTVPAVPARSFPLPMRNAMASAPMASGRTPFSPVTVAVPGVRRADAVPVALRAAQGVGWENLISIPARVRGDRGERAASVVPRMARTHLPVPGGRMEPRTVAPGAVGKAASGPAAPGFGDAVAKGLAGLAAGLGTVGTALAADWQRRLAGLAGGMRGVGRTGLGEAWHGISGWRGAGRAAPSAGNAETGGEPLRVIVMNPHDIGNATGMAVTRGMRVPAATTPSLPSPAAMPWAPGPVPVMP